VYQPSIYLTPASLPPLAVPCSEDMGQVLDQLRTQMGVQMRDADAAAAVQALCKLIGLEQVQPPSICSALSQLYGALALALALPRSRSRPRPPSPVFALLRAVQRLQRQWGKWAQAAAAVLQQPGGGGVS
jgi:hypothetical protein